MYEKFTVTNKAVSIRKGLFITVLLNVALAVTSFILLLILLHIVVRFIQEGSPRPGQYIWDIARAVYPQALPIGTILPGYSPNLNHVRPSDTIVADPVNYGTAPYAEVDFGKRAIYAKPKRRDFSTCLYCWNKVKYLA